jgi:response regulator of citrate/malate metabolism
MTNKDKHVLTFWYVKLTEMLHLNPRGVTAGAVGRYVGQSRNTAKRYIDKLVSEGVVSSYNATFINQTIGTVYYIPSIVESEGLITSND